MQYTIRNIPKHLDEEIRRRSRDEHKSINEVTLEALLRAFGLAGVRSKQRDVSAIVGSWHDDPETDRILEEQRRIDPDMWK